MSPAFFFGEKKTLLTPHFQPVCTLQMPITVTVPSRFVKYSTPAVTHGRQRWLTRVSPATGGVRRGCAVDATFPHVKKQKKK